MMTVLQVVVLLLVMVINRTIKTTLSPTRNSVSSRSSTDTTSAWAEASARRPAGVFRQRHGAATPSSVAVCCSISCRSARRLNS